MLVFFNGSMKGRENLRSTIGRFYEEVTYLKARKLKKLRKNQLLASLMFLRRYHDYKKQML